MLNSDMHIAMSGSGLKNWPQSEPALNHLNQLIILITLLLRALAIWITGFSINIG